MDHNKRCHFCDAWENVLVCMLRLSCVKILDQDYDYKENIEDREDIEACLELATSILGFTNVNKDDIVYSLQKMLLKRDLNV